MNNLIPAVDKTVQLLLYLSGHKATQSELCRELDISMSTTYRILATLQHHRWVRKLRGGVYELAEGMLALNSGNHSEIILLEKVSGKLSEITLQYGIAGKISLRRGDSQITYFRSELPDAVSLTGRTGSSFPLGEGSVGAVLLADESYENIMALLHGCRVDIPEKSNPELLFKAISEVKEQGFVLNLRRNRWNIAALSVPVRNHTGSIIAALTLIGTVDDFAGSSSKLWSGRLKAALNEVYN